MVSNMRVRSKGAQIQDATQMLYTSHMFTTAKEKHLIRIAIKVIKYLGMSLRIMQNPGEENYKP